MILIFNTYITDTPYNQIHGEGSPWDAIREIDTTFRRQRKVDIFRMTLDSYKAFDFEAVYLFVKCEKEEDQKLVENHIKLTYPDAHYEPKQITRYGDYSQITKIVNEHNDWVFYSPNNDHIFWASSKTPATALNHVLSLQSKDQPVGVFYSHLDEFRALPYQDTWMGSRYNTQQEPRTVIEDKQSHVTISSEKGENTSVQILSPELWRQWFDNDAVPDDKKIVRAEELRNIFHIHNQISVIPKFDLCAHFDGQPSLNPSILPPLFIPNGYFQGMIQCRFNKTTYDKNFLNIHPRHRNYAYLDPYNGTDFIGHIDDLPWVFEGKLLPL